MQAAKRDSDSFMLTGAGISQLKEQAHKLADQTGISGSTTSDSTSSDIKVGTASHCQCLLIVGARFRGTGAGSRRRHHVFQVNCTQELVHKIRSANVVSAADQEACMHAVSPAGCVPPLQQKPQPKEASALALPSRS